MRKQKLRNTALTMLNKDYNAARRSGAAGMRLIDLRYPYCSNMYGFALDWIIFAKSCAIRSPA